METCIIEITGYIKGKKKKERKERFKNKIINTKNFVSSNKGAVVTGLLGIGCITSVILKLVKMHKEKF